MEVMQGGSLGGEDREQKEEEEERKEEVDRQLQRFFELHLTDFGG